MRYKSVMAILVVLFAVLFVTSLCIISKTGGVVRNGSDSSVVSTPRPTGNWEFLTTGDDSDDQDSSGNSIFDGNSWSDDSWNTNDDNSWSDNSPSDDNMWGGYDDNSWSDDSWGSDDGGSWSDDSWGSDDSWSSDDNSWDSDW